MPPTPSDREPYERGQTLAEQGRHEEALACMQEHLLDAPDDGEALNDAGALLHALGRYDEAAGHLHRALEHLGDERGQALWNLAEVYLASGRPDEVMDLFDKMAAADLLSADLVNRTAEAFVSRGRTPEAIEALLRTLTVAPGQKDLIAPMLDMLKSSRAKIAFFCDSDQMSFLPAILDFVGKRFPVRLMRGMNKQHLVDNLSWCDIAWFEWCTSQVVLATRLPKVCRTVVRLHRYEAYESWPEQVDWDKVDRLILVGSTPVRSRLRRLVPGLEERTQVVTIPSGVDLEKFELLDRPRGKDLACVANLRMLKNPMFLLQCFHRLHEIDPEYRLFFAGVYLDEVLYEYLEAMVDELGLRDCVFFDGWQDDVSAWLAEKHYLVSGSIVESQGLSILEGMARGLRPVIHTFPGCRDFYPDEYLFRTPEEFCRQILEAPYEPAAYRRFVEEKYPLAGQLASVDTLLRELEANPLPAPDHVKVAGSGHGEDVGGEDGAAS